MSQSSGQKGKKWEYQVIAFKFFLWLCIGHNLEVLMVTISEDASFFWLTLGNTNIEEEDLWASIL